MILSEYFNPKKTVKLFELKEQYDFLKNLILEDRFPRALLITGKKGIGKASLIIHLMHFIFNKNFYNEKENLVLKKNSFYNQLSNNLFQNIIYLDFLNSKSIKIEDIRNLKNKLLKSSLNNLKRFIILDDVETYNINSLNALLKIIEEPTKNSYFILINNSSKQLLETIKSRCLEFKINLNENERKKVISSLFENFNHSMIFRTDLIKATPGNFLKFNFILERNKIDINNNFMDNFDYLVSLYKKEKDIFYKDLLIFFSEYYLESLKNEKKLDINKFIENRSFIAKNINNFFLYNLNQNTLLNSIRNKLFNE